MLITVAGVRTHVVLDPPLGPVTGPPVVLLSGLAGNWFDWDACVRLLNPGRTVVRFDRPGYGRSDPWPDGALPTLDSEVTRIRDLLEALDIESAVLCGHSMASFHMEAFARLHPERTAGLVLVDGSVEESPHWVLPESMRPRLLLRASEAIAESGFHRFAPYLYRAFGAPQPPDEHAAIISSRRFLHATLVENGQYAVLAHQLVDLIGRTELASRLPVTVAAAYSGRPTPWAAAWLRRQRALAQRLGGRFAVVAPSGHHAMVDQPAQVAALILDTGPTAD